MQFELLKEAGSHIHTDGKTYKAGDVIESNVNLENMFRGKFKKVYEAPKIKSKVKQPDIPKKKPIISTPTKGKGEGKKAKATPPANEPPPEPEVSKPITEHKYSEYGADVSAEFPLAERVELVICEQAHWYTVIDPEDNEVMNKTKLRKDAVNDFLEQYVDPPVDPDEKDDEE